MPTRVYPDPSAEGRVGIGREGELYETADAERLIGMGIVTRSEKKAEDHRRAHPSHTPLETPAESEAD